MAQLTASGIAKAAYGLFSGLDATDEALLKNLLLREQVTCRLFDAATAGTAMTETAFWRNSSGANKRVISTHVVAPIAVANGDTHFVTFTLSKRAGAGAAVVVATGTSKAASLNALVAFVPEALTATASAVVIPDGSVLTALVSKDGNGLAITAATSDAYMIVLLEPET